MSYTRKGPSPKTRARKAADDGDDEIDRNSAPTVLRTTCSATRYDRGSVKADATEKVTLSDLSITSNGLGLS